MTRTLTLLILAMLWAVSCGRVERRSESDTAEVASRAPSDLTASAYACADSLLAEMTIGQKAAQVLMPAIYSADDYFTLRKAMEYGRMGTGGIILLKGDSQAAAVLSDSLAAASAVIPFVAIDAEWGLGMRFSDEPRYPSSREVGKDADEESMYLYGAKLAAECRRIGINMLLGPVLDIADEHSWMGSRSYGDDPRRVADLTVAYARGIESEGVLSVAKHFPGHGSVSVDSHKQKPVIDRSLHSMDSTDLYPYKKYIEQRLSCVMVGHLAVPSIDSKMLPAAISPTVISDLLRDDLGFKGLVLTDALNMKGAEGGGAADALRAGADIILAPVNTDAAIKEILDNVQSGALSEAELNAHVRRILFYKSLLMLKSPARARQCK